MTVVLRLIGEALPWLLSFPAIKLVILALSAVAMCFGGYVYFTGQSAKSAVEVLRRENSTISRTKAAIEMRVQTDNKVYSMEEDAKLKELSKWAK